MPLCWKSGHPDSNKFTTASRILQLDMVTFWVQYFFQKFLLVHFLLLLLLSCNHWCKKQVSQIFSTLQVLRLLLYWVAFKTQSTRQYSRLLLRCPGLSCEQLRMLNFNWEAGPRRQLWARNSWASSYTPVWTVCLARPAVCLTSCGYASQCPPSVSR